MHPVLSRRRFEEDIAGITPELCAERQWEVFQCVFLVFDVGFTAPDGARLRTRFLCDDWNDRPPAIELRDYGGSLLSSVEPNRTSVFNGSAHSITGRPFVCMRGSREYHTHDSHQADLWENLKKSPDYRLGEIVTQVWRAWRREHP